jgi:hypothetical protein
MDLHLVSRSYLRCPDCGSAFSDEANRAWRTSRDEKMLRCLAHGHRFGVRSAVADLLQPRYTEVLERLKSASKTAKPTDIKEATLWLSDALDMELRLPPTSQDRTLRRLLVMVSTLRHLVREMGLTEDDIREVYAILAAEAMAGGYREHVADPARASLEAVNYEKYEDILLRKVLTSALSQSQSVALIELGSGPGRLLHQYGSTLSTTPGACEYYRRLAPKLYQPDSLPLHERLKLLLGVDFSRDMLLSASKWLVQDSLGDLVESGRIAQMRATVRDVPLDFAGSEWRETSKVACILFQTLGNQLGHPLQVAMLRSARECIGDRGVVFVSVFNAESFSEQGQSYYESIEGSVGGMWGISDRAFLSNRGVYSRWLYPDELKTLFADAGMADAKVLDEHNLASFPEFSDYIDAASQERYKRRALVGVYARGISVDVA